jgi:hypothetical protein
VRYIVIAIDRLLGLSENLAKNTMRYLSKVSAQFEPAGDV